MGGGVDYELTVAHGGVREIPNTRQYDVRGTFVILGSGFREDFIQQHPQVVIHFVNAIERSRHAVWDAWNKNPQAVRKAYADITASKGGNPTLAQYYRINYVPEHQYANDADIQWWIDILVNEGKLTPGQIKPSDVYTYKYNQYYSDRK
jgi:ABC-type nitrate/sulfonate/bicarbonate transport system substrate-binding protein